MSRSTPPASHWTNRLSDAGYRARGRLTLDDHRSPQGDRFSATVSAPYGTRSRALGRGTADTRGPERMGTASLDTAAPRPAADRPRGKATSTSALQGSGTAYSAEGKVGPRLPVEWVPPSFSSTKITCVSVSPML
jgi:hypothetical protein